MVTRPSLNFLIIRKKGTFSNFRLRKNNDKLLLNHNDDEQNYPFCIKNKIRFRQKMRERAYKTLGATTIFSLKFIVLLLYNLSIPKRPFDGEVI